MTDAPRNTCDFAEVFKHEKKCLGEEQDLTALCLSGGGVRSAAFALGCLQALARTGLLKQFSYLSTVSGGGYIGGWLTRLIDDNDGDVEKVETILAETALPDDRLDRLRRYVNYLTPRPGPASSDTWQGVVLWLRNTAINWMIFLPLLTGVAILPLLYAAIILAGRSATSDAVTIFGVLVAFLYLYCVYWTCADLPSHRAPPSKLDEPQRLATVRRLRNRIVYLLLVCALALPTICVSRLNVSNCYMGSLAPHVGNAQCVQAATPQPAAGGASDQRSTTCDVHDPNNPTTASEPSLWAALLPVPIGMLIASTLAYIAAWFHAPKATKASQANRQLGPHDVYQAGLKPWLLASSISAGFVLAGLRLAWGCDAVWFTLIAAPWLMLAELVRSTVYVALRDSGRFSDLDREWLARLSGERLKLTAAFGLLVAAVIVVPDRLLVHADSTKTWILALFGLSSGPASATLGHSILTKAIPEVTRSRRAWIETIATLSVWVFMTGLLIILGHLASRLCDAVALETQDVWPAVLSPWARVCILCACLAIATALVLALDNYINFNLFSMHATYRNRLIRAFLGTATAKPRSSDAYTSFSTGDNLRMEASFEKRCGTGKKANKVLYPVIGMTLNRTTGADTARAQRKAAPFTVTPHYCGSSFLRHAATSQSNAPTSPPNAATVPIAPQSAYLRTAKFFITPEKLTGEKDERKGITLGTAMALSGAAISPNRGYASSPTLALIMTLFNVRLGAWYPNPFYTRKSSGGRFGWLNFRGKTVVSLIDELLGRSDELKPLVYLSDGGHFDNLGLYEMLQRHCRRILVIDAGEDGNYRYADLGRTLEHARVDLGIEVDFGKTLQIGQSKTESRLASAKIIYPGNPGPPGQLLYLKPWVPHDAPARIRAYDESNIDFPHRPTLNQFFQESDFENYRALGEHLMTLAMTRSGQSCMTLSDLIS
ncbi:hypothetical protein FHR90_003182 [Endobacter medicaginis]|uniref:Patatin-like phospholipase family protein n=1 Tax=Endobacter medicaginis TaxID=1181271 RepID=A0A839UY99_9PROT|nr:patatin-like phospholipase family protein [Endobacter medicaginis]MBB3175328.1 hypothetical protein [Endobacter medicaginis]MCX5477228.1 patatin-like phospholipase family protein [Endobacter medicaginis]NVN30498.1 patatin-like phospholipase family protein [Endobacter medicaginis]